MGRWGVDEDEKCALWGGIGRMDGHEWAEGGDELVNPGLVEE